MGQDFERDVIKQQIAIARTKSYTGSAILVLVLYFIFWLPGLIANILYYSDAKRMERVAGYSLPGSGCLAAMLWLNVISVGLSLLGLVITVIIFGLGTVLTSLLFLFSGAS